MLLGLFMEWVVTIFKACRTTLLIIAIFVGLLVAEYAVRYFYCPCGTSCICDPCLCGEFK